MTDNMNQRYEELKSHLRTLGSVVIGLSGGVDSALLAAAAYDALGREALAVSGHSATHPESELADAKALAAALGIRHFVIDTTEMDDPDFAANGPRRCYFCKKHLFGEMWRIARDEGLAYVIEGSNRDDLSDYRPGMDALRELGVRSPFVELNIGKDEIRALAHERGLTVWDKPAAACLASRVPYGEIIDEAKLDRIEKAEDAMRALGFRLARARDHGDLVRLEIDPALFDRLTDASLRARIVQAMKDAGYRYVSLDLQGYRRGAMNETLND
jgi:uncharacterized protein